MKDQKSGSLEMNTFQRSIRFHELCASTESALLEQTLREDGFNRIIGIDEAGRGPLAGPVVACACILPSVPALFLSELTDSKKLTENERERLYKALIEHPEVEFAVSVVSHEEIDRINILQATFKAMRLSVEQLQGTEKSSILVDGNKVPPGLQARFPTHAVIKGDYFCPSISAASIIAKVHRDRIVAEYDKEWPHFQFKKHKGYGTRLHISLIKQFGPLPVHRKTFKPVSELSSPRDYTLF